MDQSRDYLITRLDNGTNLLVARGTEAPKLISVGGRWDVVNRPRRKSMTQWNGDDPYKMDVPILFDGFFRGTNQETDIAKLSQMRIAPSDYSPPPQIRIEGALPVKGATWVLDQDISWGDNVIWHDDGYRLRQDCVIHLLQYVPADSLSVRPAATSHVYTVKPGDTLKSIAKQELGDPKLAGALKKINKIRDPKFLPKTITIPAIIGK